MSSNSFDPDLAIAKQQIAERIARHKEEARQAVSNVAAHLDGEGNLPVERKQAIRSLTDNLDGQITGIESASHETLASARRQIIEGTKKLKAELEAAIKSAQSHLPGSLNESVAGCAQALDNLDGELQAAEEHLAQASKKT